MRRALLAALLAASPVSAQRLQPRLEFTLPSVEALAKDGATIRALDVVSDAEPKGLLESGFPARLHYRVELWSAGRVFDQLRGREEWDVFVYYDALGKKNRVVRVEREGDAITSAGQFNSFEEMVAEVERPSRVPVRPRKQLRGQLSPAVRGDGNPGTALGRGIRRMFVRLLGAERRNLQARSRTFVIPP